MKNGFQKPKSSLTPPYRSRLGRAGEEIAATFFCSKGFVVIERNWRCRFGEIDLIVEREGKVRFVEVKMRRTGVYGYPEAAVTSKKLRHLQAAIDLWCRSRRVPPKDFQADVLAIFWPEDQEKPQILWIEGV